MHSTQHVRFALILCALAMTWLCAAAEKPASAPEVPPLPEGDTGLAAKHPNDVGIDKDPSVVFADPFENGTTKFDNNWGGVTFTSKPENVHSGTFAMECKLDRPIPEPEKSFGPGVSHHFKDGYDVLFLRYYAKFGKDTELFHGGTHDGGSIFARAPGVPDAKPGIPADGKNEYTALLDTWRTDEKKPSPGNLVIYCYHPEQKHQWGEHFFPDGSMMPYSEDPGRKNFFGNEFKKRPNLTPERDKWICYELMVKANTPGKRDGRIAFWVDGKLTGDFPNLRLRDVDTLKANRISLGLGSQNGKVDHPCFMWFDDVVVATSYIGPMVRDKKAK